VLVFLLTWFDGEAVRKRGLKIASTAILSNADIAATSSPHEYRAYGCVEVVL
jgi:hypothetical protein